jgi:FtsZ-binding cell division protein ZapB
VQLTALTTDELISYADSRAQTALERELLRRLEIAPTPEAHEALQEEVANLSHNLAELFCEKRELEAQLSAADSDAQSLTA